MPRPLRELRLAILPRVEPLPAALDPVGGGEDPHGGGVVRHEAADVVVCETAVSVRSPAPVIITSVLTERERGTHPRIQVQYSIQSQLKWEW